MGARVFVLDDGTQATVPDDAIDKWMQRMDQRGVKFRDANMTGEMTVGEPEVVKREKPWFQALAETANDAAAGLSHGATMHLDSLAGDATRARTAEAQQRSPNAFTGAETVGSVLPSIAMGAAGLAGSAEQTAAGWLSRLGAAGAQGTLQGAVRGYGDSDPEQSQAHRIEQAAEAGVEQGGLAAALHTGISGLTGVVRGAANGIGEMFGGAADKARASAYGVGSDELAARAKDSGQTVREATEALVREGERLSPPNTLTPISPAGYQERFKGVANGLNSDIEGAINQARAGGAQLPPDPRLEATQGLNDAADAAILRGTGDNTKLAAALRGEGNASAFGSPVTDPFEARNLKIELDKAAYKGEPGSPESFAGQAAKTHADQYRGMLDDYVKQGAPDAYPGFRDASSDYGVAATLRDSAGDLDARQQAAGGFIPKALGAAAGAAGGYMAGGPGGAMAGAVGGYGLGGVANNAMRGVSSPYLPDLGANIGRGVEGAGQVVGQQATWLGQQAPTASALAAQMQTPAPPNHQLSTQDAQSKDQQAMAATARGYLAPGRIKQALQSDPRLLGPYAQQLSQAKDDAELEAMVERLGRTDSKFASTILPRFSQGPAPR